MPERKRRGAAERGMVRGKGKHQQGKKKKKKKAGHRPGSADNDDIGGDVHGANDDALESQDREIQWPARIDEPGKVPAHWNVMERQKLRRKR